MRLDLEYSSKAVNKTFPSGNPRQKQQNGNIVSGLCFLPLVFLHSPAPAEKRQSNKMNSRLKQQNGNIVSGLCFVPLALMYSTAGIPDKSNKMEI